MFLDYVVRALVSLVFRCSSGFEGVQIVRHFSERKNEKSRSSLTIA